jgi:hypothetical protein
MSPCQNSRHRCGTYHDHSSPVLSATAVFPSATSEFATKYCIESKYPYDINFVIASGHDDISGGVKWIGPDGWVGNIAAITGRKLK